MLVEAVFTIVNAALTGLLALPLFIVWVLAIFMARRRKDPARVAFTWLKVAIPFEILAIVLNVVADVIAIVLYEYEDDNGFFDVDYDEDVVEALQISSVRLSTTSLFFERMASCLTIIVLAELGNGFLFALDGQRTMMQKIVRYVAYGVAGLLFVLDLAYVALINVGWTSFFYSTGSYIDYLRSLDSARKLSGSFDIIGWIVSIALLAQASFVMSKYIKSPFGKGIAGIYLAAAVLWFVRWLWFLIYDATWLLGNQLSRGAPISVIIVDAIFNFWLFFIVLVLIFSIGAKKAKGLWTTSQPFMGGAPPPLAMAASGKGPVQPQFVPHYGPPQPMNNGQPMYQPQPGFMPQQTGPQYGAPQQQQQHMYQQPQPGYMPQQHHQQPHPGQFNTYDNASPPPQQVPSPDPHTNMATKP